MATERARVLVDAGLSRRETLRRLASLGEPVDSLDAILISHEHHDHVAGMVALARALNVPIYLNERTRAAIPLEFEDGAQSRAAAAGATTTTTMPGVQAAPGRPPALPPQAQGAPPLQPGALRCGGPLEPPDDAPKSWKPVFETFRAGQKLRIKDIEIEPFTIPHDAADPVAFCLSAEGIRIGVCTDLGYMPDSIKTHLRGCHCLVLESNHDLDMLKVGPYPWAVKQRVMSRTGHLSNDAVSNFILQDYDGGAAVLVLAHLSEQNNHPEIARLTAAMALETRCAAQTRLVVSSQKSASELFRF